MRRLVKSVLQRWRKPLARNPLLTFFTVLQRLEFDPKHVVDVGANEGLWTRQAIQFFPRARYTLIEPQDHLKQHIQDLIERGCQINWINAAVADRPGTLPFTISRRNDSSSLLPTAEQAEAAGHKRIQIEVKTLNEIVSFSGLPMPEMVKIDAEGFDLKVLTGASDLVGKTDIFFLEAAVCARDIENTVALVIRRMDEAGYCLVDITDLNRSPKHGVLWLCELAFLRKESRLLDRVTSYE